jgi:hypothetical protein
MRPPIISVRAAQIDRPRPVPPNWRVIDWSAWTKRLNNRWRTVSSKPTPVSLTMKLSPPADRSTLSATSPRPVNFTALASRLFRIWLMRPASPR